MMKCWLILAGICVVLCKVTANSLARQEDVEKELIEALQKALRDSNKEVALTPDKRAEQLKRAQEQFDDEAARVTNAFGFQKSLSFNVASLDLAQDKFDPFNLGQSIAKIVQEEVAGFLSQRENSAKVFQESDADRTEADELQEVQASQASSDFFDPLVAQAAAQAGFSVVKAKQEAKDGGDIELPEEVPCVFTMSIERDCDASSPFREISGRCASGLDGVKKTWGMSGTAMNRILPAQYEDGVEEHRVTGLFSGNPLPNARQTSMAVSTTAVVLDFSGSSNNIMQWGQFITHDFTHRGGEESNIQCCPDRIFKTRNGESQVPTREQLEIIREEVRRERPGVCIQVETQNDPIHGDVCMNAHRTVPVMESNCVPGARQQMNTQTAIIDGSVNYGTSEETIKRLRTFTEGLLKTGTSNDGKETPPEKSCERPSAKTNKCPFDSGDSRINTTPYLASTQATFIASHNRIARRLAEINPHWDDERLFQEARRINAAIQANIHFNEWIPKIIGPNLVDKFKLNKVPSGFYTGFNPDTNPAILNEFSTAAMRFGHSTVGRFFQVLDQRTSLGDHFGDADLVYENGFGPIMMGLIEDVPWKSDRNFVSDMRDTLFNGKLDIFTLNINRGRDHGLDSYVNYRKHYGLSVPTSFDDLSATHPADAVEALRKIYSDVRDVELYPGGMTELPINGGLTGELFAHIIADQTLRQKSGDRLYFEGEASQFTLEQVENLRSIKFSGLLCDVTPLAETGPDAFLQNTAQGNEPVGCRLLSKLDISLWRESGTTPTTTEKFTTKTTEKPITTPNFTDSSEETTTPEITTPSPQTTTTDGNKCAGNVWSHWDWRHSKEWVQKIRDCFDNGSSKHWQKWGRWQNRK